MAGPSPSDIVEPLIDREEVAELALAMANIDSASPHERAMAEFVGKWLEDHGFAPRYLGLSPERPNILAVMKGSGGGRSLLFNSHMDTSVWYGDRRVRNADDPIYHQGWREGDRLVGHGVMNDKGPMAAWMIACRAIREAGVPLRGDVLLSMVVGETGSEPVDEFQGPEFLGKDAGARHLAIHGGVADYVLVAEATAFGIAWVEAGKVFIKVTVHGGTSLYTPYVTDADETSALMRARAFLNGWHEWAAAYTRRHTWHGEGGSVEPRASIGAIRAGLPHNITRTPESCDLYLDLRTRPGQSPSDTVREVEEFVRSVGLEADVELFLFRPGYQANGVEPLAEALRTAHRAVFGADPGICHGPVTSMWRDSNVWNELGIPAAMYGPGGGTGGGGRIVTVDDLYRSSQVYAATALEIAR